MKLLLVGLISVGLAAPMFAAEGLSQGDRDRLMSHLYATRKMVIDHAAGLTDAQWNFKAADDKWSIAGVVEHLALTERALFGIAKKVAEGAVAAPEKIAGVKDNDDKILKSMTDRTNKAKAPEMLQPTGKLGTGDSLTAKFRDARDVTLDFVRTTQIDLRSRVGDTSSGGRDGAQWIYTISAHTERHVNQIKEIKADAKYPAK